MDHNNSAKTLDILQKDITVSDGIRITDNAKKEIGQSIDIYVIVEYGTQIPKLAWELQKEIEKVVKKETSEEPYEINIHIEGVNTRNNKNEKTKS